MPPTLQSALWICFKITRHLGTICLAKTPHTGQIDDSRVNGAASPRGLLSKYLCEMSHRVYLLRIPVNPSPAGPQHKPCKRRRTWQQMLSLRLHPATRPTIDLSF